MKTLLLFFCFLTFDAYVFAQVVPQNGSANYNVPIFSFNDSKTGLSTSITLSYSSGNGLLVSSKASNTGVNWSLFAGGFIARKQNGEPDDQNSTSTFPTIPNGNVRAFNGDLAFYDANYQSFNYPGDPYSRDYIDNYYPNGFMYSEFSVDMADLNVDFNQAHRGPRELPMAPRFQSSMDRKYKQSRRSLTDREQDVFMYSFNGLSGEFVIGKDHTIQMLDDSKLKIVMSTLDLTGQNIRTRINEFVITDIQGIEYKFSSYDLTEVLIPEEAYSYGIPAFTYKISIGEPTGKYTIQKWLLTEIVKPATQEKIVFTYETYNVDIVQSQTPTYQYSDGQTVETVQMFQNRVKGKFKRLLNINLPDGHSVDIDYNNQGNVRPDFEDDNPLKKIKVKYNNVEMYNYTFNYGYFLRKEIKDISVPVASADKRFTRLCLKSVFKTGSNGMSEPPNKFEYYTGFESNDPKDIVPPFDCLAEDHWGYYTKNSNLDIEVPLTKETVKSLILNSSYRDPTPGTAALGLLKRVQNPLGSVLTFEYEQNDSKDADFPTQLKTHGGVRVSKTILFDGVSTSNNIVSNYYYKESDGSTSGWGYETPRYLVNREIKIWNAGNLNGYTNEGKSRSTITVQMQMAVASKIAGEVGSKIMQSVVTGTPIKGALVTSALPPAIVLALIMDGFMKRVFTLFNPTTFMQTHSYNFNSFESQNPIGVHYSRVEVVDNSTIGGTGKTVYEFTKPLTLRTEVPALSMPFAPLTRFSKWKYDLPYMTKIFDQAGNLLKESTNTYFITDVLSNTTNNKSCKVEVVRSHSAGANVWNGGSDINLSDFNFQYYYPRKGRAELIHVTEVNYGLNGTSAQSDKSIVYNDDFLPKSIGTIKSNGDILINKYYYANDYNNLNSALLEMKYRNMISIPISEETWLSKPNGSTYLVGATVNEFIQNTNAEVKLAKVYSLESKIPLPLSLIGEQSPTTINRNPTYFKEEMAMAYNADGLLIESSTPDGKYSTQLYDHNKRLVIANVLNAHNSEVAYSSFETDEKGNWNYDLINLVSGDAVTGIKYYHFPASGLEHITTTWNSAKEGLLSFWKKGGNVTTLHNGLNMVPVKVVPNTETGWTYLEYYFTGTGILSIYNNSTIDFLDIDELRLYPKDARMSTTAYDPLKGKISECDINNRIIYNEYDGLGRLIHIKDENKNILKKICYNYAGEPENCIDFTDNSPQWRDNGTTMCQLCPQNLAYNSGIQLKYQVDVNYASSTFQQGQWVVDPDYNCPSPPVWSPRTDLAYCEQVNGIFTGNYITPTFDVNPCSSSYFQFGQPIITPNHSPCIPVSCGCPPQDEMNPNYIPSKCINGVCVQATWESIRVRLISKNQWDCTYAYCYPDGTIDFSQVQSIISTTPCSITCQ